MERPPGPWPASSNSRLMPSTAILLATGNRDKQGVFRTLLDGLPFTPVTPAEAGVRGPAEEEGETHEAIARDKAARWSSEASMLAIASDGGLVIPALGARWESRYTHRFAGPAANNTDRLARLLELMGPHRGEARRASWVEALAIADRGRVLASWELAGAAGYLDEEPPLGPLPEFWVFSVWRFPQFGAVYAQLTSEQRGAIDDHWERLGRLARRYLTSSYVGG